MILQALKEYYDRKSMDTGSEIAPLGFERKELQFLIVIDKNGNYITIEDTREKIGKKLIGKTFLLPRSTKRSGSRSYETTFLLWDHIGYLFGQPVTDEKTKKQHETWISSLKNLPSVLLNTQSVQAIIKFYENNGVEKVIADAKFEECLKATQCNMAFKLVGEQLPVPCSQYVHDFISNTNSDVNAAELGETPLMGICLVTGEYGEIARTHGNTPINKDTKCLIGVQRNCGYDSYYKEQGFNSPIIKTSEFAYVTALNTLLKSSTQRMNINDVTMVFWSAKETVLENDFTCFFSEPPKDDPGRSIQKIKALYDGIKEGNYYRDNAETKFYVLGLSPNAARIAIRFWQTGTVAEFAEKIKQHFDDLVIIKPEKEPEYYSVWRLLVNIAAQDKSENIPPNIAGDFIRAILTAGPYPATLLQAALRRIHSDTDFRVKPVRAALIKAYLNRYYRIHINPNHKEIQMSLDTSQPSNGYQLGRLFATLEKIQEEANPGLNATIRERYYGSACASPVTVFSTLLKLKNHHIVKIPNPKRIVYFESLLGEIMNHFNDFPPHLDLHEQGCFAVGYYHQRQDFFTKKETIETIEGKN